MLLLFLMLHGRAFDTALIIDFALFASFMRLSFRIASFHATAAHARQAGFIATPSQGHVIFITARSTVIAAGRSCFRFIRRLHYDARCRHLCHYGRFQPGFLPLTLLPTSSMPRPRSGHERAIATIANDIIVLRRLPALFFCADAGHSTTSAHRAMTRLGQLPRGRDTLRGRTSMSRATAPGCAGQAATMTRYCTYHAFSALFFAGRRPYGARLSS